MFPSGRKLGYFKRSQTYDNHDVFENQDLICVSLSSNEIHFVVVPHFTTVKVMLIVSIVDPLIVFNCIVNFFSLNYRHIIPLRKGTYFVSSSSQILQEGSVVRASHRAPMLPAVRVIRIRSSVS